MVDHWHTLWSNGDRGANDIEWCAATATTAFGGLTQHQERREANKPGHGPVPSDEA